MRADLCASIARKFRDVRAATVALVERLTPEDAQIQAMPDVSPPKWHLAHTTWFFETFILLPRDRPYRAFDPEYTALFNSYYETFGSVFSRPNRGLLSRPDFATVKAYREAVDLAMSRWLETTPPDADLHLVELGLHHEMQHQELILTDLKYNFYANPLRPAYRPDLADVPRRQEGRLAGTHAMEFLENAGGLVTSGADASNGTFVYDNETPRHKAYLEPFALATRLVTNAEYLEFVADHGYSRPELWLADGWATMQSEGWHAPLYWECDATRGDWRVMTMSGMQPLALAEPVAHVSYYEADAYARWIGARLPTEVEWEVCASRVPRHAINTANFLEADVLTPRESMDGGLAQMFGDVWEWTASPYVAYPGYRQSEGALGEYNGKFMCNQMVLRGGSCLSPGALVRSTYRNFFPPTARWQCSGVRLARDL